MKSCAVSHLSLLELVIQLGMYDHNSSKSIKQESIYETNRNMCNFIYLMHCVIYHLKTT